jgi:hypothetical protein
MELEIVLARAISLIFGYSFSYFFPAKLGENGTYFMALGAKKISHVYGSSS